MLDKFSTLLSGALGRKWKQTLNMWLEYICSPLILVFDGEIRAEIGFKAFGGGFLFSIIEFLWRIQCTNFCNGIKIVWYTHPHRRENFVSFHLQFIPPNVVFKRNFAAHRLLFPLLARIFFIIVGYSWRLNCCVLFVLVIDEKGICFFSLEKFNQFIFTLTEIFTLNFRGHVSSRINGSPMVEPCPCGWIVE